MPIPIQDLEAASQRGSRTTARSLIEAKQQGITTAFLCHSHKDESLIIGLERILEDHGCLLYVDWKDTTMPAVPNRETAQRIQQKIVELKLFLFLATPNSVSSRWCPWEIGYADGKKRLEDILIIPTSDSRGTHGNEYLQSYRRIDFMTNQRLGAWFSGDRTGISVAKF